MPLRRTKERRGIVFLHHHDPHHVPLQLLANYNKSTSKIYVVLYALLPAYITSITGLYFVDKYTNICYNLSIIVELRILWVCGSAKTFPPRIFNRFLFAGWAQ